ASGNLVAYYDSTAVNDDQFEPTDSSLIDLRLPADGKYFVRVHAFHLDKADTGRYELFIYRFDAGNPTDLGDTLEGRGGNDVLEGGLGNDRYVFAGTNLGSDVVREDVRYEAQQGQVGSRDGHDTLDFTGFGAPVSLDLANPAVQVVSPANLTLQLSSDKGVEDVFGTRFDDVLKGNTRDNLLWGGPGGNDRLEGADGNDTFLFEDSAVGTTTVVAGAGMDMLDFGGSTPSPWHTFTTRTTGVTVDLSKVGTAQAVGSGLSLVLTAEDMENVTGSYVASNYLTGNSLNNVLTGGTKN